MRTIAFNQFDGGMTSDPRNPAENASRVCKNFDSFTYPHKLTPYRSSENGDSQAATLQIANYTYTNSALYGLGVVSGTGRVEIYKNTDFTGSTWNTTTNNSSAAGTRDVNVFVPYHGFIYGLKGGNAVWSYKLDASAFNDSFQSLTYTNTAPGLVHSKDDVMYIPYDNKIASYNFGTSTWTAAALTLPTNLIITSICEHGNYLAIGCKPVDAGSRSKVFLWDRDSSLTTLSESIDWGEGDLFVLEEVEGYLVGVSLKTSFSFNDRLIFRYYLDTSGAKKFTELISSTTGSVLKQAKQKVNNRLFFMATFTINGVLHEGVWSVGRNSLTGPFAVNIDRTPNNDTLTVGPGTVNNFIYIGDYLLQSYVDNSLFAMSKTNDTAVYTATAIYETTINPEQPERMRASAGMRSNKKQILAALIGTEPLPSGAQVVVKYRVDGGAWTTYFTHNTVGATASEMSALSDSGTEFEFRFESTGGAEITEFKYKTEVNDTLL